MPRRLLILLIVGVMCCAVTAWGDVITLTDGTSLSGKVSRVVLGQSIEVLTGSPQTGQARVESLDIGRVARVVIEGGSRGPDTLILKKGDQVPGTLVGSPLEKTIQFITWDNTVVSFDADAVSEVRLGIRVRPSAEFPAVAAETTEAVLTPSFGLGLSLSAAGVGITRDAIAWFSKDWMLLASLGLQGWLESGQLNLGLVNEVTYLLRIGTLYVGVGTGALYNMTAGTWHASVNFRVVFPITFAGKPAMTSIGATLIQ